MRQLPASSRPITAAHTVLPQRSRALGGVLSISWNCSLLISTFFLSVSIDVSIPGCFLLYVQLVLHQCVVNAPLLNQFVVGALFADASVFHHHNLVGISYGTQPVGNYDGSPAVHEPFQSLHDLFLVVGIQRIGGLIHHQIERVLIYGSGNEEPLFLSLAQSVTVGTNLRI